MDHFDKKEAENVKSHVSLKAITLGYLLDKFTIARTLNITKLSQGNNGQPPQSPSHNVAISDQVSPALTEVPVPPQRLQSLEDHQNNQVQSVY